MPLGRQFSDTERSLGINNRYCPNADFAKNFICATNLKTEINKNASNKKATRPPLET
jgi:hypothetical protein